MYSVVKLYSDEKGQILSFLRSFFQNNIHLSNDLFWQKEYQNPIEIADIIAALVENDEDYKINMWISLDKDIFINVTENNADSVIRYLFERYPY